MDNKTNKNRIELLLFICFALSLGLFLFGFFPLKHSVLKISTKEQQVESAPKKQYVQKLIFVVIDALRYDFVAAERKTYMPFLDSSIRHGSSCVIKTKAHAPTVTLPRIKAITSGSVPNFIDIFLNFQASNSVEESFVSQAALSGHKLVFYGDDTWLKLFPGLFTRSDGTTSFFVTDYTEVDNNVTRHLDDEIKKDDWSILILHYLGLDHIGHLEGPYSPLVVPKLREMDRIIEKLANYLKNQESKGVRTMFLMTGDHGMTDMGSHGGVSYPEVTVPLVLVGSKCLHPPGWPDDSQHPPPQIDIAPTVAAALGIPTPSGSMGKIIPNILNVDEPELWQILQNNRNDLRNRKFISEVDELHFTQTDKMVFEYLKTKNQYLKKDINGRYFFELNNLSAGLVESSSDFNVFLMTAACILMWTVLIAVVRIHRQDVVVPRSVLRAFLVLGTVGHTLSFCATSFIEEEHQTWYFLWTTLCLLLFTERRFIQLCIMLVLQRILRKLNQTGDKWSSLPDIEDFLTSSVGKSYLVVAFLLSLTFLLYFAIKEKCSRWQLVSYSFALIAIASYRTSTHDFPLQYFTASSGVLVVKVFWGLTALFLIQSLRRRSPAYLTWSLVSVLLYRPSNAILVPTQILFSKLMSQCLSKQKVWNSLAHVWIGQLFYFYQGNSNSIANIDVAAGYIGLAEYHPLYAALLIACHTYSAHITAFFLSPKCSLVIILSRIIPTMVFSTLVLFQRHHLFIWSVFTPKLLYEVFHTLIILTLVMSHVMLKK